VPFPQNNGIKSSDDLEAHGQCKHVVIQLLACILLQAFAKDGKLLQLLKTFVTKHALLADTPASQLSADQVKQLHQVVQESGVNAPEAFKLDEAQVGCSGWCSLIVSVQRGCVVGSVNAWFAQASRTSAATRVVSNQWPNHGGTIQVVYASKALSAQGPSSIAAVATSENMHAACGSCPLGNSCTCSACAWQL
jgi:hypothetical protein